MFRLIVPAALAQLAAVSFAQMNVAEVAGEANPGALVTATNTATGVKVSAMTGRAGDYRPAELAPGLYVISASAEGFKQAIQENALLHAGERIDLKFSVVLGERSETLIVEAFPGCFRPSRHRSRM
jgi:hypothetical protein